MQAHCLFTENIFMSQWLYIVECSDGSLYTGITKNVKKRVQQHNEGKFGAKSIRGKRPVVLVYKEKQISLSKALKREREIKGWRREKKLDLIKGLH
jgi:putative endonuclease